MASNDQHWLGARAALAPNAEVEAMRRSLLVPMRDGVGIAIDVYVPRVTGHRTLPAILRQTRYCRSLAPRGRLGLAAVRAIDHNLRMRRAFLAAGFAWIDADVRGSGASGGTQRYSWNPDEVKDGAQLVDWIVAQPWSNGKVGSLGISYDGTCAEMLLVNRHPAVRAVAPLFSLYDAYTDIGFPGGVHLAWFTEHWGRFNALLDRNAPHDAFALMIWMLVRARLGITLPQERTTAPLAAALGRLLHGIRRVDGDDGRALAAALADHAANYRVHEGALRITHRDDTNIIDTAPEGSIDSFSPHAFAGDIAASGATIYSYSGWRDGAYNRAAIRRHGAHRVSGGRLTIGPWNHAGRLAVSPFAPTRTATFDHAAELINFFGHHLDGRPDLGDGDVVHYFTMGEERWKSAPSWPPPGTTKHSLYLADEHRLVDTAPAAAVGADQHRVDPAAGTGTRSRWRCMIAPVPPDYPDRAQADRTLLVYDSAPLASPLEVTGDPAVSLHVAWLDATDGAIFAYLEDVAPDGRVGHVTEGVLRALHRAPRRSFTRADARSVTAGEIVELSFHLLPISYRFAAGHRIRLAISGADADSFAPARASTIELHRRVGYASRLDLPVVRTS
jgi:putative CocE/NonD family hydrolase